MLTTSAHQVHVRLAQSDRATFLSLVSMLHRRGVEVISAELGSLEENCDAFRVTFRGTDAQAATVTASLRNLVYVSTADLVSSLAGVDGLGHARMSVVGAS